MLPGWSHPLVVPVFVDSPQICAPSGHCALFFFFNLSIVSYNMSVSGVQHNGPVMHIHNIYLFSYFFSLKIVTR